MLLESFEKIISQQFNAATLEIIICLALIYLLKPIYEHFVKNYYDKKASYNTEFLKVIVAKRILIFEKYFTLACEANTIATVNITDECLKEKCKNIRPHLGSESLYLDRREIALLNEIADNFTTSYHTRTFDIMNSELLINELKKCLEK